jgi:hypothetical protein
MFWLLWMAFDSIQFGVGDQIIIGKELHNLISGKIHNMLIFFYERKLAAFEDASRDNITQIIYVNALTECEILCYKLSILFVVGISCEHHLCCICVVGIY